VLTGGVPGLQWLPSLRMPRQLDHGVFTAIKNGNVTRENDDELVVLAGPYFQRGPFVSAI